ncbi:hypothetical protein AT959_08630 [Dechloromonas denitrificans]|uniref:AlpA family transcriptional regulator n=1 Tax=Dechloromonas denitrificans TaxID=281362 RepID=A0A133XIK8_9RHOO|nr:AlpA family phage regulatory protein [Dechloromonas denitrificans]KXB30785.1 hypothetical protein AT959_08630 [Dechloromonas denitrificans]
MVEYMFMPIPEVERATGLGKTKIYDSLNPESDGFDPDFPKPVVLSRRCVRWRSDEIQGWLDKKSATSRDYGSLERKVQAQAAAKASVAAKRKNTKTNELAGQG